MTKENEEFVKEFFRMETGLQAKIVSPISFGTYMIEASDGNTYMYRS